MTGNLKNFARTIYRFIIPHSHVAGFDALAPLLRGRDALEIGGPSEIFFRNNIMPVYPLLKKLDICNFRSETIWEKKIKEGQMTLIDPLTFKRARRLIHEASDLKGIASDAYDVLLASHVIEHVANPLKAVAEWKRVLKNDGVMIVVAPDRRFMFDRNRDVTAFDHILSDHKRGIGEDDLTHLDEVLSKHDISLDLRAGDMETFKKRSRENFINRGMHHHVFDEGLLKHILEYSGLKVISSGTSAPMHIYVFAGKEGRS
jgi:SAM-dependent methyltransferase